MGQDKLDQWPEPTLVDWLLQALYILNSLTLSLLPTLLGLAVLGGQSVVAWAGLALVPLVFPLILLSMLEEGSAMVPYSGSIWQHLVSVWWAWLIFHAQSALWAAAWVGLAWATRSLAIAWMLAAWVLAATVGMTLYLRLLGRLAYVIGCRSDDHATGGEDSRASGQLDRAAARP